MPTRASTLPIEVQKRHRRPARIRALMIGLPAVAALLVAANVAEVVYRHAGARTTAADPTAQPPQPKMINPRFTGSSRDGRTYVISGREGVRDNDQQDRIQIVQPVLVMHSQAGEESHMSARAGTFDESDHTLLLKGDVKVDRGGEGTLAAEQALVDTRTGTVTGSEGLEAQNTTSQVRSSGYEAYDKGARLVFKGGVRGRLDNSKK